MGFRCPRKTTGTHLRCRYQFPRTSSVTTDSSVTRHGKPTHFLLKLSCRRVDSLNLPIAILYRTDHRSNIISRTSMTIAKGQRLGSYEILALIGSGGQGEVYRAH